MQKTPEKKQRSKLKYVTSTELNGFEPGDLAEWRERIRYYRDHVEHSKAWKREGGLCIEVHTFVELTNAALAGE